MGPFETLAAERNHSFGEQSKATKSNRMKPDTNFTVHNLTEKQMVAGFIVLMFMLLGIESLAQRYNLEHVDFKLTNGLLISGQFVGLTNDSLIILDKNKLIVGCVALIKLKNSNTYIHGTVNAITEFTIILTTKEPPHEQQIQKSQIKGVRIKSYPPSALKEPSNRSAYSYADVDYIGIHKLGSGAVGAIIGGAVGAGLGFVIGAASHKGSNGTLSYNPDTSGAGLGILGFLIGTPIGAAIGSSNKRINILGKREKYDEFLKMVKIEP